MNTEENKLQEAIEGENSAPNPDASKKKLPMAALIGIIMGAVAIAAILLVIILGGGDKKPACTDHVDADDNLKCDNCGVAFEDGFEANTSGIKITLSVLDGGAVAGAEIYFTRFDTVYTAVTGDDGSVSLEMESGEYTIGYNYDTIPEGCAPNEYTVKVDSDITEINLTLIDNNPDGSAEKPFYLSENETEISIEAGEEMFFNYIGSVEKHLVINSDALTVNYNGQIYEAQDGVIDIFITPEIGTVTVFSVKNTSDAAVTEIIYLVALLGSFDNPITLDQSSVTATVPAEGSVYYSWTPDKDGILVLTVESGNNSSVGVTRILENDIPIFSQSDEGSAYMLVKAGEAVSLCASTMNDAETEIIFSMTVYAGTESEPVPISQGITDIYLAPGESLTFIADGGSKIEIDAFPEASLIIGGETINPNKNDIIKSTLPGGEVVFTVVSGYDGVKGITIEIK